MSTTHLVLFFFALSNPIALALDSSSSSQQASITPGTNSFTSAFANGFTMVGATELGDKVCVSSLYALQTTHFLLLTQPLSSYFSHDRHFG